MAKQIEIKNLAVRRKQTAKRMYRTNRISYGKQLLYRNLGKGITIAYHEESVLLCQELHRQLTDGEL